MTSNNLSKEELDSVKTSFMNILTLLSSKESLESKYIGCLIKWAVQLQFEGEDLRSIETNFQKHPFQMPGSSSEKLDSLVDLVHMIYLDNIVEEIELEIASKYAEQLGFEKSLISEIFQELEMSKLSGRPMNEVKSKVKSLLRGIK